LDALEAKCDRLRASISAMPPIRPVLPANFAETYRNRVGKLERNTNHRKH